jgi:alkylation response protein AidB-like acyl-CoA dehydrogenase
MIYVKDTLSPGGLALVEKAEQIASQVVAPLAPIWDKESRFPYELFSALHAAGLDSVFVPKEHGGLGLGPDTDDALTPWLVTKAIASADSSCSQCQQVHNNCCYTIAAVGSEQQRRSYFGSVVEQSVVMGGWGSEGGDGTTIAKKVPGGYELNGRKLFATNAGVARRALVTAFPEGKFNTTTDLLNFMINCESPGFRVEPGWWERATGMRASVSHEVVLDKLFVKDEDMLGAPGSYLSLQLQARVVPNFAANFQGVGSHVFDYGLNYLRQRKRFNDSFVQHHMAEAQTLLISAELMLAHTARLYSERKHDAAFHSSRMVRAYSESAVARVLDLVEASCGSSFHLMPSPMERVLRDWHFYRRHENRDLILSSMGKTIFGLGGETSAAAFGFSEGFRSGA